MVKFPSERPIPTVHFTSIDEFCIYESCTLLRKVQEVISRVALFFVIISWQFSSDRKMQLIKVIC